MIDSPIWNQKYFHDSKFESRKVGFNMSNTMTENGGVNSGGKQKTILLILGRMQDYGKDPPQPHT